jgi:hypothetical protein
MPAMKSPTTGHPPPPAESSLERSRESRYKGGTLIAEEVGELAEHLRRVADADRYRPAECARCGHETLHVHDHVERHPLGDALLPAVVTVLVFRCALPTCGATWRILPRFLARHLWHAWRAVERVTTGERAEATSAPTIAARTVQRWRHRLASSGRMLVVLMAMAGARLAEVATKVGLGCTRGALVAAFVEVVRPSPGLQLAAIATVVHRLARGIRLM